MESLDTIFEALLLKALKRVSIPFYQDSIPMELYLSTILLPAFTLILNTSLKMAITNGDIKYITAKR